MFVKKIKKLFKNHKPKSEGLNILKYIGPGFLVTVGFIDPGNWAANMAAGSYFGYSLLWMVTLSTIMLIVLQHNSAHLGIVTGLCLAEASTKYFSKNISRGFLSTAMIASVSTVLAEILGSAIGLNMLFKIPLPVGALLTAIIVYYVLVSRGYRKIEKIIIGFISLIGLSFLFELSLVNIDWPTALTAWVTPSFPSNSIPIIMSVLGAVVMPHNIFLHSEIIQSRKWNLENQATIKKQLKFEFLDTMLAMIIGWAINSSMILIAASLFFVNHIPVTELSQAEATLRPMLGGLAANVFAIALIFSGFASSVTACMAGGSIFAGFTSEPFDASDNHSRLGVAICLIGGFICILLLSDPFAGLIWSQIVLSIQLPFTIIGLIWLISSKKVMGKYANSKFGLAVLLLIAVVVIALNIMLLIQTLFS